MSISDQDLARRLSTIARSVQPKIEQSGNTLYITINGQKWKLQSATSQVVRSQGVRSR